MTSAPAGAINAATTSLTAGGAFNDVDGATNVPVSDEEWATHKTIRFAVPGRGGRPRHVPDEFKAFAGMETGDKNG